jgi:methyl-accepting chemotaxis protein
VTLASAEQIGHAAQSLEQVKVETESVSRSSDELAVVAQQLMDKVSRFRM